MYNIYHPRTDNSDSNGSKSTIIIIAVCSSVGGLIVTALLYRVLRRLCRRAELKPSPLPPVQPLAHQREQQLIQFLNHDASPSTSRPGTWFDTKSGSRRSFYPAGSDASLLPSQEASGMPSRQASLTTQEQTDNLYSPSPLSTEELTLPSPPFHGASTSSSGPNSGSSDAFSLSLPETPMSASSSSLPHGSEIPPSALHGQLPRSQSYTTRSRVRPRPVSMVSISSAHTARSRMSTIRGAPHGPYSNVQIILPTPLAASTNPYNINGSTEQHSTIVGLPSGGPSRLSVVDQWVSTGQYSASRRGGQRSMSAPDDTRSSQRRTQKPHSHDQSPLPSNRLKKQPSAPAVVMLSSPLPLPINSTPPVPIVPSVYAANPEIPTEP